jgi:hypothetical protein
LVSHAGAVELEGRGRLAEAIGSSVLIVSLVSAWVMVRLLRCRDNYSLDLP